MSDLIEAIKNCDDFENSLIKDMPYKEEISNGSFVIDNKTLEELLLSLYTFSYLGVDSSDVVKEIVWIIGGDRKLFDRYFEKSGNKYGIYKIRDDIDKITLCEFKRVYPNKEYHIANFNYRHFVCKTGVNTLFDNMLLIQHNKYDVEYGKYIGHAAYAGNLRLVKWLLYNKHGSSTKHDNEIIISDICGDAAKGGNLEIVKWFITEYVPEETTIFNDIENNISYDYTISAAIQNNHYDIVKWLHNYCGYEFSYEEFELAVNKQCDPEIIKWFYSFGFPFTKKILCAAVKYCDIETLKWIKQEISNKSHRQERFSWDRDTFSNAAERNDFEIIKWLRQERCPFNASVFSCAIMNCSFEILKWLRQERCPWNECIFINAFFRNDFEIIKWLKQEGCPWNKDTFSSAVKYSDFEIIKWLREEKCPISCGSYKCALSEKKYDIFKWLIINTKCPNKECECHNLCCFAAENQHYSIVKWLLQREKYVINKLKYNPKRKDEYYETYKFLHQNNMSVAIDTQYLIGEIKKDNYESLKIALEYEGASLLNKIKFKTLLNKHNDDRSYIQPYIDFIKTIRKL